MELEQVLETAGYTIIGPCSDLKSVAEALVAKQ